AVLFAGVAWVMVKHHTALYTQTMALGIVMFAIGTGWWALGRPMVRVVWWWVGYFVLTIAGERLELGRLTGAAQRKGHIFRWALVLTMFGLMLAEAYPDLGVRVYALGMLGLGGWLLRYDIAWFTIHRPGLPRFAAWCLLTGYVWLIFGALIVIVQGLQPGTFSYDAALHSVLLGFVFSMIFGHAPIIFPALLGLPIEFHPGLYVALAMLHISLIARVLGDVIGNADLRLWGGMFNAISMLVYFGWMAVRRAYQELRRRLVASG
ncbi:MAG: hypothetical protein GXO54_06745, partial [Chloroflexi bacterium]|nr:hypothetical protein [Chloroflexota bacterium]